MWIVPPLFNPRMTSCGLCYQQNYRWSCQCPRLPGVGSQWTEWLKNSVEPETLYYARMSLSAFTSKNFFLSFFWQCLTNFFQRWQLSQEVSDRANKQWLYPESWKMILNELLTTWNLCWMVWILQCWSIQDFWKAQGKQYGCPKCQKRLCPVTCWAEFHKKFCPGN